MLNNCSLICDNNFGVLRNGLCYNATCVLHILKLIRFYEMAQLCYNATCVLHILKLSAKYNSGNKGNKCT